MINRFFLVLSFLIFFCLECFANYEDDISNLELTRYGKSYNNEVISQRLLRLEEDYFGMVQSGDIYSRIEMLNRIQRKEYPHNITYNNYNNSQGKNSKLKNMINGLADIFSNGVVTGFTPPMNSYEYNNFMYGNNAFNPNSYSSHFQNNQPMYNRGGYVPHYPDSYNSSYNTSNIEYDRYGNPRLQNRELLSRSAVHILRD